MCEEEEEGRREEPASATRWLVRGCHCLQHITAVLMSTDNYTDSDTAVKGFYLPTPPESSFGITGVDTQTGKEDTFPVLSVDFTPARRPVLLTIT